MLPCEILLDGSPQGAPEHAANRRQAYLSLMCSGSKLRKTVHNTPITHRWMATPLLSH